MPQTFVNLVRSALGEARFELFEKYGLTIIFTPGNHEHSEAMGDIISEIIHLQLYVVLVVLFAGSNEDLLQEVRDQVFLDENLQLLLIARQDESGAFTLSVEEFDEPEEIEELVDPEITVVTAVSPTWNPARDLGVEYDEDGNLVGPYPFPAYSDVLLVGGRPSVVSQMHQLARASGRMPIDRQPRRSTVLPHALLGSRSWGEYAEVGLLRGDDC